MWDPPITFLGNLLERVCFETEFEVEGWKKITPLIRILEKNFSPSVLSNIRLEMKENEPIENKQQAKKFINWIKNHLMDESTKETKIALYVNQFIPINKRLFDLDGDPINNPGNHCVVVKGIKLWKHRINGDEELHEVKCFEIENFDGNEQMRYIPVDHPCFEEIQGKVNDIKKKYPGSDDRSRSLNKLGENLAKTKYGKKLETNWFELKTGPKTKPHSNIDDKYPVFFFRCLHPSFQLKFNIS